MFRLMQIPVGLGNFADTERERWGLWLAPCLGLGIGLYFALPGEPPLWVGFLPLGALFLWFFWLWRRNALWAVPLAGAVAVAVGFTVAQLQALHVAAPVLERPLGPVMVSGRVADLEPHGGRWRVTLAEPVIERLAVEKTPNRVRLTLYARGDAVPGGRIAVLARLLPPPPPAAPGSFDFPRLAWFAGLGAVGYAVGLPEVQAAAPPGPLRAWADWVTHLRGEVAGRLSEGVGGPAGGVAAALATGHRGAVPEEVIEAYRASGLAHLLAISGLHLGLAAGLVFVVLRGFLAMVPAVALRWNIKKITASVAILAMVVYLALSGANVPAQRAFLMGGGVFGAILADRSAVTLRVLAVAAVLVLLWQPDALIGASFQMSFAAVLALVAAYEWLSPRLSAWRGGARGPLGATGRTVIVYLIGILASTVIAGLATAPFAAYHFHRVAVYGVVANMVAMPVMALWVMPWLALALLLMPFGLDALAHAPLRWGLEAVEVVARVVASWPHAQLAVPPMPVVAVSCLAFGGLWLCLTRGRWRWGGVPVILGAIALPWLQPVPLLVISGDGAVVAVRGQEGLIHSPGRGDSFTRELWAELWPRSPVRWQAAGWDDVGSRMLCDARGCLFHPEGSTLPIALPRHPAALLEDCRDVRAVVATVEVSRRECAAPLVISKWDLWRGGAHALYEAASGELYVESVAGRRGNRPWTGGQRW